MKKAEQIEALNKQLKKNDDLWQESKETNAYLGHKIKKWSADTRLCIVSLFGENNDYLKRFDSINYSTVAITITGGEEDQHKFDAIGERKGLTEARKLLKEIIDQSVENLQSEYLSESSKNVEFFLLTVA